MEISKRYGMTIDGLRIDIYDTLCRYLRGRDWFGYDHRDLLMDAIIEVVNATKFRRTDGIDGWMHLYVYADGSMSVDYNVLDHFKVNDKLVFRWDVCGNDKFSVMLFDYSKEVR